VSRLGRRGRFTAFQAGAIALIVIAIGTFLAFSKDVPFTRPFEIQAVFENVPPLQQGTAVRIAGVDVGKVSKVEPLGGGSPATRVTIRMKDEGLPLHEDATLKLRPRIFFEGNNFIDLKPGTPSADAVDDGHTFPITQTSGPVQIDQVLGTLTSDSRKDLQKLLQGYGNALNGKPAPGEDDDQDPAVRGLTAGQALNASLANSAQALRGGAVVNQALLGTQLHDLSKLVGSQQRIFAALSGNEGELQDLLTNWNVAFGALAAQSTNLSATIRELPRLLEAAGPALDELNASFGPTRAWALEMVPGTKELPATIDAALPWIAQTRALLRPSELQGLVDDLAPTVPNLARFAAGQLTFVPKLDAFNRCQYSVVLPTGEQTIEDGALSTGFQNYKEFWQGLVGLSGESQNFDGNGSYARFQPGGGGSPIATGPVGRGGPLYANATAPPLGTRPARTPKPPYKPNVACHRNAVPSLNAARTGGGP
jgi:phospholipid/cholesterol/gamma-HCH transport system substrate-binding protein